MLARTQDVQQSNIYVAEEDYERLESLARNFRSAGAALLGRELERAVVVPDAQTADGRPFVRLGGLVEYLDPSTGQSRRVEITTPDAADIDEGRLSVLSPVGAALIGLAAGDSFSWVGEDGRPRAVVVKWVGAPSAPTPDQLAAKQ